MCNECVRIGMKGRHQIIQYFGCWNMQSGPREKVQTILFHCSIELHSQPPVDLVNCIGVPKQSEMKGKQ